MPIFEMCSLAAARFEKKNFAFPQFSDRNGSLSCTTRKRSIATPPTLSENTSNVIASVAKQSRKHWKHWIASSLKLLAMTVLNVLGQSPSEATRGASQRYHHAQKKSQYPRKQLVATRGASRRYIIRLRKTALG